ncbi:hypothetical protein FBQ82_02820 [Anaerolineae bacterium CFX7]|nr:hypothetical protein [Anaerolineae bacterium CFX7]
MEKIKITQFHLFPDPDISELDLQLNGAETQAASVVHVNDETSEPYHVDFRINPETNELVGATILYSANLFQDLARAFASMDLNHPDVRFFLEKKLEQYAERHHDELTSEPETLEPQAA